MSGHPPAILWHHFRQRRLATKFYATTSVAFIATLALMVTAYYVATALLGSTTQLANGIRAESAASRNLSNLLAQHRDATLSSDVSFRVATGRDPASTRLTLEHDIRTHVSTAALVERLSATAQEVARIASSNDASQLEAARNTYLRELRALEHTLGQDLTPDTTAAPGALAQIETKAISAIRWIVAFGALALLCVGPLNILLLRHSVARLRIVTRALKCLANGRPENANIAELRDTQVSGVDDEITAMVDAIKAFQGTAISLNESREELRSVNQRLNVALENMSRGLSMFGPDERLIICNTAYRDMYQLPAHLTVHGASLTDLLEWRARASPGDGDVPKIISRYRAAVEARSPLRYVRKLSDGRTIEISLQPLENGGWVTLHQDVTKEREAEAQISRMAKEDALTGLANRRGFTEALELLCKRDPSAGFGKPQETQADFALFCIDLDLFKSINDTLGHPAGDEVLRIVAQRLKVGTRQNDSIARIGGDEFAVLLSGITQREDIERVADRLVALLAEPMTLNGTTACIGASIGIEIGNSMQADPSQVLAHADIALYWSKSHGRNTWRIYDAELEAPIKKNRQIESELRPALAANQFSLNFQPILGLAQRDVVACEALLRWHHPQRGTVSPADFIPLAEKNGFIKELGAWVLREACSAAMTWPDHVRVAVNVSPVQLASKALYAHVVDALTQSGLSAERLELEVTETALLDNGETTLAVLHDLKNLGIKISLDDFGTGYSSLSNLRAFPFDQLKIDQSFVRDITNRDDCVAIVKAVASLAASLDMTTVAEGVETLDHLHRINLAGCTAAQGYLFSKPVPASDVPALFEHWRISFAA